MNTRRLGDARTRSLEEERVATVTIPDTERPLLEGVPRSHRDLNQLLFEPLSRQDATALTGRLAPVRDHTRSAPPRPTAVRRRRT